MNSPKNLKQLEEEILLYAGTKNAEIAKVKYEILKLAEERKRNRIGLWNTLLLSLIAIANLIIAFMKFHDK